MASSPLKSVVSKVKKAKDHAEEGLEKVRAKRSRPVERSLVLSAVSSVEQSISEELFPLGRPSSILNRRHRN